jgi:hypothetical protein
MVIIEKILGLCMMECWIVSIWSMPLFWSWMCSQPSRHRMAKFFLVFHHHFNDDDDDGKDSKKKQRRIPYLDLSITRLSSYINHRSKTSQVLFFLSLFRHVHDVFSSHLHNKIMLRLAEKKWGKSVVQTTTTIFFISMDGWMDGWRVKRKWRAAVADRACTWKIIIESVCFL